MPKADWFEKRLELEKNWKKWRKKIAVKGLPFIVMIPLDRIFFSIEKEFTLCFLDNRGGSFDNVFHKPLAKQTERSIDSFIKKAIANLPIGKCSKCGKKALVRNANITPGVGESLDEVLMCERCWQNNLRRVSEREASLYREKFEQGFKFVLSATFAYKKDKRKVYFQSFHKTKPSPSLARTAAKENGCKLVAGSVTISKTSDIFIS